MVAKLLRRPDVVHFGILREGNTVTMKCGRLTDIKKDKPPLRYCGWHSEITCEACNP